MRQKIITDEQEAAYIEIVQQTRDRMAELGTYLSEGSISPDTFEQDMRDEIKALIIALAILGAGTALSLDDEIIKADLELFINANYALLDDFMEMIRESGADLSVDYLSWRSGLYANARHAFVRFSIPADLFVQLDAFPGISCLGDGWCGCSLEVDEDEANWYVYWELGATEHCVVCLDLAGAWNPLTVSK